MKHIYLWLPISNEQIGKCILDADRLSCYFGRYSIYGYWDGPGAERFNGWPDYQDEVGVIVLKIPRYDPILIRSAHPNVLNNEMFGRVLSALLLAMVGRLYLYAEEDASLSAITQEAQKVEAETQPTLRETGEPVAAAEDGFGLLAFEEDLKTRCLGSYTFYLKLPERSREEVFLESRDGASIGEIREKIMDHFLNQ
jgi:hypothetical protein